MLLPEIGIDRSYLGDRRRQVLHRIRPDADYAFMSPMHAYELDLGTVVRCVITEDELAECPDTDLVLHADARVSFLLPRAVVLQPHVYADLLKDVGFLGVVIRFLCGRLAFLCRCEQSKRSKEENWE